MPLGVRTRPGTIDDRRLVSWEIIVAPFSKLKSRHDDGNGRPRLELRVVSRRAEARHPLISQLFMKISTRHDVTLLHVNLFDGTCMKRDSDGVGGVSANKV
jgi:hypothetical protein